MFRRQEDGRETFCARSILLVGAPFWNSKPGSNAGSPTCPRYEKMMKDKLDDEIKLAGLGSLVPLELENSNRLRTFEGARLEVVTYVDAKFGLRLRDSKPSDTGLREHSDVGAVTSLVSSRTRVIRSVCWKFQVRWSTFSTRLQCKQSNRLAKANRASHGPRGQR